MNLSGKKKRPSKKTRERQQIKTACFHFLRVLIFLTATAAAVSGCRYIHNLGIFKVQHIRVYGNTRHSSRQIARMADIEKGGSIFTTDIVNGSKKLESDPWIHRAVIKRLFPDKIEIIIKEHTPIAVIQMKRAYLVDKNGILFKTAGGEQQRYPRLTGCVETDISQNVKTVSLLDSALNLIHLLKENAMLDSDVEIIMNRTFGITLADNNGQTKTRLGFDHFDEKIILLKKIKRDLAKKGLRAKNIHLRSTEKAYITM